VVKWGVEVIGGSVRFESREPTGTRVILTIPTLGPESGEAVAESRLEVPPDVAD
jgi:hypothetical protein